MAKHEIKTEAYSCSRLGRSVMVTRKYAVLLPIKKKLFQVDCSGQLECGIGKGEGNRLGPFDWSLCPMYMELHRRGLVDEPPKV